MWKRNLDLQLAVHLLQCCCDTTSTSGAPMENALAILFVLHIFFSLGNGSANLLRTR